MEYYTIIQQTPHKYLVRGFLCKFMLHSCDYLITRILSYVRGLSPRQSALMELIETNSSANENRW